MALSFNIQYDPKKYEPIVQGLRDIYKYAPDPAGFEASYMTANIIAESFPHINKKQAFYDSPKLIEAYTGYKLDTQGFLKEFGKTFQAQREDLKISMMFSRAMMATDEEERKRRLEEANEYMQGKLLYRNDFKDMSIFTDLLVSSGKLLPSMLPTIGMHLAGAVLAPITGGLSVKAATVGGALYSGMMEAGGLVKELYNLTDENGNRLGDEYIRTAWTIAMAGVGGLNLFTQGFEKLTGSLIPKLFGKKSIKNAVKSGLVANWAAKRLAGYAGNILSESLEEATEELISMLASNYVTTHSNETYETLFEGHSPEQIIKAMAQTAVETAKGMVLTALPGQTISAVRDYYASDNHIKREANKYSGFTDDSIAVETRFIKPHSVSKPEAKFEKFESPIDVIDVDGTFVPVNIEDSSKVKSAIMSGARALNVRVVNNKMNTATIDTETSSGKALNIASRTEGSKYVDNMVVFDTIETAQKEAKKYATRAEGLSTYETQPDGSVLVGTMDGERSSAVIFTSKDLVGDGKTVYEPTLDQKLDVEDEFEKTRPDRFQQRLVPVRKQFQTYRKALQSKGATEEDIKFLNENVLEQLYRTVKEKFPDIGDDQAYSMAIPSTYFAYLAAKVADMSPQEFFETHFTPEKFAVITHEQEQEYLASAEGQQSIEIEGGLQAKQEGTVPVLGGLVWRDKATGKKTIGIASGYTPLTVVHEIGHVLVDIIKDTPIFEPFKVLYKNELEQDGGTIGRHFQEKFASDLELYIKEGKTADKALRSVFSKIVDAIKSFVKYVAQDLDEPTRKAFDDLFDLSKQQEPTSTVESGRAIETSLQSDRKATAMPPQSDRSAILEPQQELFETQDTQEPQVMPKEAPVADIEPQQVNTPVQLDLFGDPDEVADRLAQIATQAESMEAMTQGERLEALKKVVNVANLDGVAKIANSKKWRTSREMKLVIQESVIQQARDAGFDITKDSEIRREYLREITKSDTLIAIKNNKNAVGWYAKKTAQALDVMSLIHPELKTDEHARFAFIFASAVTSNGIKLNKNFELAEMAYSTFKETGRMPTDIGIGKARQVINEQMGNFNKLVDSLGIDDFMKFMLTDFKVSEITSIFPNIKISGEHADVLVKGAAIIGPKLGNGFFSNMFGDFSKLTIDRWLMVTWGRWTGTLLKINKELTENASLRLQSVVDELLNNPEETTRLSSLIKYDITKDVDLEELALAIDKASTKSDLRNQIIQTAIGNSLRLAGNNLSGILDGQKLSPDNGAERKVIRAAFYDLMEYLHSTEEYKDITISDVQAILWYAEKRLFESSKKDMTDGDEISGYQDDEAPDYANAAVLVARSKGISDDLIQGALKEYEDGRSRAIQSGLYDEYSEGGKGRPSDNLSGEHREAKGFNEKEKRRFLQERTIINARANRKSNEGSPWSYERGSGGDVGGVRLLKPLGVTYVNEWKALTKKGRAFSTNFFTTPNIYELEPTTDNATVFQRLISENKASLKYGSAVMTYEVDDYQQMRLFLTEDGTSGVAIKKDGDIVSVFSAGGNGRALMELAISAGGRKLDCFDTILPQYYAPHGFRAVARIKWDDSQAPVDWNKETFKRYNNGEPDVVFMVYDPSKMDAFYSNKDGKLFKGNPETAYNNAVKLQTKELNALNNRDATDDGTPDTLASIEYRVGLQGLKEQLRNGEYPADRDLERYKGDPDVDWEIQFRKISYQDPAIIEMVSDAYDRLQKEIQNLEEGKTINENDRLIQIIDEMVPEEMRIDIGEEAGNVNRFLDRVKQQLKYKSYKQANKEFDAMLSDNQYVLDVAKRLTDGIDRSKDSDISAYIFRLADHPNPSPYAFRMAKSAIRNDLAKYRRMLLRKEGNDAQISYEDATFVNEITEMPSRYENDEVRTLLSGNTDPVIKSIIRRGLATENTLNHVIETMTADIEAFKKEFGLQELTIEALMKMLDEADSEYKRRNLMYLRLQEINKKNHDRYAKLKKSVKIRTDALKAKAAMERLLRKGDRLTTPTPNYDANIMHELNGFWKIMKSNDGGVKKPLNHLFKQYGLSYENMHDALKQFFEEREDGIYFKKKMNRMSLTDLRVLENIIRAIKGKARGAVNEMKDARNDRVLETVQKFLASSMNIDPGTFEEMIGHVKEAKGRSIVNDGRRSKGSLMGTINTQFLTMSRLIDQIDPSGALREWVFGRAGVDKILADEIRMQNDRYEKGKSMMESLGIKMADLNKEFHRFPRIGRGGQEIITYDMAVGLYVYEKQPDAKAKLLSPDGNGYTQEELDYIIDNLPQKYKDWGDYLIKDMISRHGAIADVYYRVKNKRLGFIANYFPLVRGVDEAKFEDMLEEEHYERNQNPADQFTYKRTGGTYPLALNATNVWHRLVHKQEHYISAAQWVNDTQYMLGKGGGDLFGAIEMTKGHEYAKAFQDFVNRFANRYHVYDTADVISNHIRSNLVIARLGFNIITALKQIPSLFYFTVKFGPIRLIEALGQVLFHYKETSQKIYELSPQLKNRSFSHDYELVTQMQGKSRYERVVQKIGKVGMAPIQLMDRLVVNTLWLGAYNANIARNMSPEEAALDATRFIGDTQPGGSVIDTAAIYSTDNALVKYLLMFSSQLNKNFNMIWADIPMALKQKHFGKAISYMLGLGMSFAGIMLASGTFAGDDDDDESIINQFFAQLANQIPVVGNAVSAIVSGDYFASDDALIIPEVNSLIRAYASGNQQRILDKWAKLGLSVGEVSGLPSGMGLKMYNTGFKDDDINLGYLLNSKWADVLSDD